MKTRILLILFAGFIFNCNVQSSYPDCNSTPAYDSTLLGSTPISGSHNFGQDCITGCHVAGGTAQTAWTIAGSMESFQGSGTAAVAGYVVSNIGTEGHELTVDVCGNFYTINPVTSLTSSRPTTANNLSGMQLSSWGAVTNPGSCNQSTCHEYSGQGYIY